MKEMLINVSQGEECRIALLEDNVLEELYMERTSSTSHVGNIYKGRVTNVEASIQAAFIDFGLGRNGFLHISDLMPTYFGGRGDEVQESVGRKMSRRDRPPIQRCLRRGDEITVQIIKEGIGTKGPTLSSYLSIPGKMLVMMPGMGKMGVSKKIEDEQERRRLRTILDSLKPPKGVAFIIRTAGIGKTKTEIERDLKYLTRLWEQIEKREQEPGPVELYTEGDLVTRTVRDLFTADVDRIVVDDKDVAKRVKDVIKISSPRSKNKVDIYEEPVPLFHKYGIEHEIEQMYSRHVPLPGGGSLVIDSTEAIVAIDVNSGKFRDHNDAEMTAFKTDMEAAEEIPRQLKLRDLGGVIIVDFIDLRYERHRRELEERLHENFKRDRAKTKVLRMSQFGIIELTRQRMRPSLKRSIYFDCPHCKGAGLVKTVESMSIDVMRKLAIALADLKVARAELAVCPDVAVFLLNKKRIALSELEERTGKQILIRMDQSLGLDEQKFSLFDSRDGAVILEDLGMVISDRPHTSQLGVRPPGHTHQGRGKRFGGQRGPIRNEQRGVPSKAMSPREDDEEDEEHRVLDQVESAIDEREGDFDPMDDRLNPPADREEDSADLPQILETESGDEVAEELADEHTGVAGPIASGDVEARREQQDEYEDPRDRQPSRDPRGADGIYRGQQGGQGGQAQGGQGGQAQGRQGGQVRGQQQQRGNNQRDNRNQPQQRYNAPGNGGQRNPQGGGQPNLQGGGRNEEGQGQGEGQGGGRRRRRGRRGGRGRDNTGSNGAGNNGNYGGNVPPPRDPDEPMTLAERLASELAGANIGYPEDHDADLNEPIGTTDVGTPGMPQGEPGAEGSDEDAPKRRRRRRGGRRHRRRNANADANADGSVIQDSLNSLMGPDETPVSEGESYRRGPEEPLTMGDPPLENEEIEATSSDYPVDPEPEVKFEPLPWETPGRKIPKKAQVAVSPVPDPELFSEPEPEPEVEPAPKKTARRTRTASKRVAPKKTKATPLAQVAEPQAVVRTGSSDKHLNDDEPIEQGPVFRPDSYGDLDAIPDDFD